MPFSKGDFSMKGRAVVTSPKIVINLPRTYKKLYYNGEPYGSKRLARLFGANRSIDILLLFLKGVTNIKKKQ